MTDKAVPVAEEQLHVGKRLRETGTVRVDLTTEEQDVPVEADLRAEEVEVRRVPVNRIVAAPVPDRREGDTLIITVIEEEVVVEKRLRAVEEIYVRRIAKTRHLRRMVSRRRQRAEVRRDES